MNKRTIRNAVGLPDDDEKIRGVVSEDPHEICENTIGYGRAPEAAATLNSQDSPKPTKQFYFASGGVPGPNSALGTQNSDAIKEFRQNQTRRTGRTTDDGVLSYSEVGVREQHNGVLKASKANFGVHEHSMMKHKFFKASGGSTSPNTEVNADHQGVVSEVPSSRFREKRGAPAGKFRV